MELSIALKWAPGENSEIIRHLLYANRSDTSVI
jgi:hypothetical protein